MVEDVVYHIKQVFHWGIVPRNETDKVHPALRETNVAGMTSLEAFKLLNNSE